MSASKTLPKAAAKPAAPRKTAPAKAVVAKTVVAKAVVTKTVAAKTVAAPAVKASLAVVPPVKPIKPAKPAKPLKAPKAPKASKLPKPPKMRSKPVRDSFTMPEADFALIATLKARTLAAKRETKKSELLRAGLHALAALDTRALVAALGALEPVKIGRPKSGH
jgi:hypothetical protein